MPPANALQVLTIATVAMGFGLFETTIPVRKIFPLSDFSTSMPAAVKTFLALYAAGFFILTMATVFRHLRDGLGDRDLVRKRGPFRAMVITVVSVLLMFLVEQFEAPVG